MARKQLAEMETPEEFWAKLEQINKIRREKAQEQNTQSPRNEQTKPETPENEHRYVTKVIKKKKNTL